MDNLAGYKSIDAFVQGKLDTLNSRAPSFDTLFDLMFSETDNILWERSIGFRMEKTTYGEARENVLRRAAALAARFPGLPHDSVVGLCMDNSLDWITTFWAILRAGFRPLLMNLRLDAAVLEKTLTDLHAAAVVSDCLTFSVPTLMAADVLPSDAPVPETACGTELFVMSSGTSESVKVCAYTAEAFIAQINESGAVITQCAQIKKHYEGQLKLLTFLPFYHIFGLAAVYIWFGFFSRTFVELHDLSPNTILNTIRRHKVTHIFAVPLFWNTVYEQTMAGVREKGEKTQKKLEKGLRMAKKLESVPALRRAFCKSAFRELRDNLFGESIQFLITGGSEVRPEVMELFNAVGYHLSNGYGMTEIGITSVEITDDVRILNAGSVGLPMNHVEYRLSESGTLQVRGSATCAYILENGTRTDNDDWYETNDLAECREGRWYILGRRDDVVIAPDGENLNPNLIEPAVRALPDVTEACLCGVRENGVVRPTLVVSADRYLLMQPDSVKSLSEKITGTLAGMGLGTRVSAVVLTPDALIRTTDIKLNRRAVTRRYEKGEIRAVTPESAEHGNLDEALSARIRALFAETLHRPVGEITDRCDFFTDGGGTSLDYFALLSLLEKEFGIPMPVNEGRSLSSVADIHDYVKDRKSAS